MNREQHLKLNVLLFILFSCMVSVYPSFSGMNSGGGWGLAWFVVLYFLAAWFRLYYKPSGKCLGKLCGWIGIAAIVAIMHKLGGILAAQNTGRQLVSLRLRADLSDESAGVYGFFEYGY